MPSVFFTRPQNGGEFDPEKRLEISWDSNPPGTIIRWKLCVGTEDGRWDILMSEQETRQQVTLHPEDYPLNKTLYAQVRGVYMGTTTRDGKPQQEEERALSDMAVWNPSIKTAPAS